MMRSNVQRRDGNRRLSFPSKRQLRAVLPRASIPIVLQPQQSTRCCEKRLRETCRSTVGISRRNSQLNRPVSPSQVPSRPFCELWKRPSCFRAVQTKRNARKNNGTVTFQFRATRPWDAVSGKSDFIFGLGDHVPT